MLEPLSIGALTLVIFSIMFIGLAKSGIAGAGTLTIPIMAAILGSKPSVGFLLPILLFSDVIAVIYYKQSANWAILIKLLPWAIAGIVVANFVGKSISDKEFNLLLSAIIIIGILITIWRDFFKKDNTIPTHWAFSASMGFLAGFTSMIGNAAGPIIALYLLTLQLPKDGFAGTRAWYFFIINFIKVPFHAFVWHTITVESIIDGAKLIPAVIIGMIIGFKILKVLPEKVFRIIMLCLTFLSAVALFFK